MFLALEENLRRGVAARVAEQWPEAAPEGAAALAAKLVIERPPRAEMGDFALPLCFELARTLRRAPRALAQEIAAGLTLPAGLARAEVAGGGYLNFFVDRGWLLAQMAEINGGQRDPGLRPRLGGKAIVEHTNINPNKAAHIGHLRNAVLGDTWARLLRFRGETVEVQNYIDDTGVQVADVAVALERLEHEDAAAVRAQAGGYEMTRKRLAAEGAITPGPHWLAVEGMGGGGRGAGDGERGTTGGGAVAQRSSYAFDYFCWDLYAQMSRRYEEDPAVLAWRGEALAAIERGAEAGAAGAGTAAVAEVVAEAVTAAHLRTMARLGIGYDLLPRESEILRLHFWREAFGQMQRRGAIRRETEGKNAGCWVMDWKEGAQGTGPGVAGAGNGEAGNGGTPGRGEEGAEAERESAKVIVRSNGTVTYVGKDIAYQLWKFGRLGRDFQYRQWSEAPGAPWVTAAEAGAGAAPGGEPPEFGHGRWVFNVIDTRQSYLQEVVQAGLRALGWAEEAGRSVHFSYEMVALTPRCAAELGHEPSAGERQRTHVEVSGRKGLGVKADDLLDRLLRRAWAEVKTRHPEMSPEEQLAVAAPIAMGAARYFLLKFTRNALIVFDFQEALSFDGETGPYVQYAAVRAESILRRARGTGHGTGERGDEKAGGQGGEVSANALLAEADVWEVLALAARLEQTVEQAIEAGEPAIVAKFAFQLAQAFNNFYHRRPVLAEQDPDRRGMLLMLVGVAGRRLREAMGLLGMKTPEIM